MRNNRLVLNVLLLITILFQNSCSNKIISNANWQEKKILQNETLESPILADQSLYFFKNDPKKRYNIGEICEYNLKVEEIVATSEEIHGFSRILGSNKEKLLLGFKGGGAGVYNRVNLKKEKGISPFAIQLLEKNNNTLFWMDEVFWGGGYFDQILCTDEDLNVLWHYPDGDSINKKSFFIYPKIYLDGSYTHVFSYDQGKIFHLGIEIQTGEIKVQQTLLIKNNYFHYPIEMKPYEDFILTKDTVFYFSSDGNKLSITNFAWNNQSLIKTNQFEYEVDPVLDRSRIYFNYIRKMDNLLIIPMQIGREAEKRRYLERPENWLKACIVIFDINQNKVVGTITLPSVNKITKVWIPEERNPDNSNLLFLSIGDEYSGPDGFNPIDQGTRTADTKTLICIDVNQKIIKWTKEFSSHTTIDYQFSAFWFISGNTMMVINEQGEVVAKRSLQGAWERYEKGRYDKYKDVSFSYHFFPIEPNQVIITTSIGYVYRWYFE